MRRSGGITPLTPLPVLRLFFQNNWANTLALRNFTHYLFRLHNQIVHKHSERMKNETLQNYGIHSTGHRQNVNIKIFLNC